MYTSTPQHGDPHTCEGFRAEDLLSTSEEKLGAPCSCSWLTVLLLFVAVFAGVEACTIVLIFLLIVFGEILFNILFGLTSRKDVNVFVLTWLGFFEAGLALFIEPFLFFIV